MKKYPVYKPESRLPGVTEVPQHWKVLRNSVIFSEVSETGYGDWEFLSILSDREIIYKALKYYADLPYHYKEIRSEVIVSEDQRHYLLMS